MCVLSLIKPQRRRPKKFGGVLKKARRGEGRVLYRIARSSAATSVSRPPKGGYFMHVLGAAGLRKKWAVASTHI